MVYPIERREIIKRIREKSQADGGQKLNSHNIV